VCDVSNAVQCARSLGPVFPCNYLIPLVGDRAINNRNYSCVAHAVVLPCTAGTDVICGAGGISF